MWKFLQCFCENQKYFFEIFKRTFSWKPWIPHFSIKLRICTGGKMHGEYHPLWQIPGFNWGYFVVYVPGYWAGQHTRLTRSAEILLSPPKHQLLKGTVARACLTRFTPCGTVSTISQRYSRISFHILGTIYYVQTKILTNPIMKLTCKLCSISS